MQHERAAAEERLISANAELAQIKTSIGHLGDSYLSEVSHLSDSYHSPSPRHGDGSLSHASHHSPGRLAPRDHDPDPDLRAFTPASTSSSASATGVLSESVAASPRAGNGAEGWSGSVSTASFEMSALDTSAMAVASAMLESIDGDRDF